MILPTLLHPQLRASLLQEDDRIPKSPRKTVLLRWWIWRRSKQLWLGARIGGRNIICVHNCRVIFRQQKMLAQWINNVRQAVHDSLHCWTVLAVRALWLLNASFSFFASPLAVYLGLVFISISHISHQLSLLLLYITAPTAGCSHIHQYQPYWSSLPVSTTIPDLIILKFILWTTNLRKQLYKNLKYDT
jgi:hypothetical protein